MPEAATYTRTHKNLTSHYSTAVTGGFVKITSHQLALWWYLYAQGIITRRDLHIVFAAVEMKNRRQIAKKTRPKRREGRFAPKTDQKTPADAAYSVQEVLALVGEGSAVTPLTELSRAIKRLGRLGVVKISDARIELAQSIEQISGLDDTAVGRFFAWREDFPSLARSVCVPRRLLRAMAGGFTKAKMATITALLLRSMAWHHDQSAFRCDGRTKAQDIAAAFGIGIRAVRQARAELRSLGILKPVDNLQWALNKWGSQDIINVEWMPGQPASAEQDSSTDQPANDNTGDIEQGAKMHPSQPDSRGKNAPPYKPLSSSSIEEEYINHKPSVPPGNGSLKSKGLKKKAMPPAHIGYGITRQHLQDNTAMLELHTQARVMGIVPRGRDAMIEFFALAEHALRHAKRNAPGMFASQVKKWHTRYLTLADYDAGKARVVRHEMADNPQMLRRERSTIKLAKNQLSTDAAVLKSGLSVAKGNPSRMIEVRRYFIHQLDWTPARYEQAEHELHHEWSAE